MPLWFCGGRCSSILAESISQKILRTQARNNKARRSATKATIRRLHTLGIYLTHVKRCKWPTS
jgi:hypothetical protein